MTSVVQAWCIYVCLSFCLYPQGTVQWNTIKSNLRPLANSGTVAGRPSHLTSQEYLCLWAGPCRMPPFE